MRLTRLTLATALCVTIGTYANAQGTCGDICTKDFWENATPAEISEAVATVSVNARSEDDATPLHLAARYGTPQNVTTLLEAGADATAQNEAGKTPWDLAKDNGKLTRTDAYGALNDARLK
jgi:ankyrin repeat protein